VGGVEFWEEFHAILICIIAELMNPLNNFLTMFNKKDQSVIGVDLGSSAIKVVQLKKKRGKAVLETYGELSLGPYAGTQIGRATSLSNEKLIEALVDLLRESNVTTTSAGISIPLSSSLVTFVKMPALDNKQLEQMIPIEARKYIPVPITEVMLDWWIVPKEQSDSKDSVDVLVVVIHNEALSKYQSIGTKAGIQASFYEIELFSTIRAALDQTLETQMVFDMGAASTKLYIVERGILKNSHTINRGSQDITLAISKAMSLTVEEAEKLKRTHGLKGGTEHRDLSEVIALTLDYIFYEANRTLLNYQKRYNKTISSVVLTGGGVLLKGLNELAASSFQTEIVHADPFSKVEAPAFLADVLKSAGPEFAVALGIALRKLQELE
jgi:type IV pilus assembly protein PilM